MNDRCTIMKDHLYHHIDAKETQTKDKSNTHSTIVQSYCSDASVSVDVSVRQGGKASRRALSFGGGVIISTSSSVESSSADDDDGVRKLHSPLLGIEIGDSLVISNVCY